jgi:lipopolysaccharide heptosyltransferase II
MKIAIFCPNWVGDLVMATPALRAVRRQFPHAEIVAVLRPYVADVLDGLDVVDRRLLHAPRLKSLWRKMPADASRGLRFAARLRRENFDLALLMANTFRSAFWAWVSGAKHRVGFDLYQRGWLLTDAVPPPPPDIPQPVIDNYLELAARIGCQTLDRTTELAVRLADEERLRGFWGKHVTGDDADRGIVCLSPGGAFGSAKHWPEERFAELAIRIAGELGKRVLVLCGPAERESARRIARIANHPAVLSLADESLSIGLTKAAVRSAELLVTTDSGPRHFAAPFRVPVITLFGPTHIAWSETYYDLARHLQIPVDCGPCQERACPLLHHRCMKDLRVRQVFATAAELLNDGRTNRRAA